MKAIWILFVVALLATGGVGYWIATQQPQSEGEIASDASDEKTTIHVDVTPTAIPIGDGHLSTEPKVGYVFSCQTQFRGRGPALPAPWIDVANGTWNPQAKPVVDGAVLWPNAQFQINETNGTRDLVGNGLPVDDLTGVFPIQPTDDAYQYDRNPNEILLQQVMVSLPLDPEVAASPTCVGMGVIGYALNGVAMYNALDAAGLDGAAREIQDACHGHPQSQGQYHYHNFSPCLLDDPATEPTLIGYAFDGYGIYKYPDRMTNADLDECHGKTGEILWDGKTVSMYHYVVTDEYPYTIGCFKGTPVRAGR